MSEPRGYWTLVIATAITLINEWPQLTGDQAYLSARRIVDAEPLMLTAPQPF